MRGRLVVDLTTSLAGAYAARLLASAGSEVARVEPVGGHPLRRWPSTGTEPTPGTDAPLYTWLAEGLTHHPIGSAGAAAALRQAEAALVEDGPGPPAGVPDRAVITSITAFGLTGPWAGRPATEHTLQAWASSIAARGPVDRPPLAAGGRLGEYVVGACAAAATAAALRQSARTGRGERVDVAGLDCLAATMNLYGSVFASFLGLPSTPHGRPVRGVEVPSLVQTADGWVGFTVITPAQVVAFLELVGRADLVGRREAMEPRKRERNVELQEAIAAWAGARTTAEVVEAAVARRIPVTPAGNGQTVLEHPQLAARQVFDPHPAGFRHPRRPWQVHQADGDDRDAAVGGDTESDGADAGPGSGATGGRGGVGPAERLGAGRASGGRPAAGEPGLPLAGVRVVDLTAFWAGPAATLVLASLGAEVIKVESVQRPDGMRTTSTRPPDDPAWLEWGPLFHGANANKRGITLDLTRPAGRDLCVRLVEQADVVIENATPRVVEGFGLDWPAVHAANPQAVMVRMPAYGLDGPWRERPGFAQTMEEATGLAWATGWPDGPPLLPRGPVDPLAGMHAVVALLAALDERDRTGRGVLVEVPLVEVALNAAAEQVITWTGEGVLQSRLGNRDRRAAPQGVYACAGAEEWLALSVDGGDHWAALTAALGRDDWASDPDLAEAAGRRAAHDRLDDAIAAWCAERSLADAVEHLWSAGVPVGACVSPTEISANEHLRARGFFETVEHPVTGAHPLPSLPFRFASRGDRPWFTSPAPTLGQHTEQVLRDLLGLDDAELDRLRADAVIGTEAVPGG